MKRRRIFFRNSGLSPVEIIRCRLLQGDSNLKWPQFENRKVIYTHLGRIGNVLLCKLWNIEAGDEILVPSYNCGSEVDPFIWFGMKAVMYRIDGKLKIDVEDLCKRITNKTRIIYVTHYFGWPQPLEDIKKICRNNNVYLIEDCALSLFSNGSDGPIGVDGDGAIHSFRKTLPVPDGAALTLPSNYDINSQPNSQPAFGVIAKETLPYIIRWLISSSQNVPIVSKPLFYVGNNLSKIEPESPFSENLDMPKDYYFSEHIMSWTISKISAGILNSIDPHTIFKIRRKNFKRLHGGIFEMNNIKLLLGDLPDGVCPLLLPLEVPDVFTWIRKLNMAGIKAIRWWEGFNRKLNWDDFPEAKNLKQELLVLPVHQHLSDDDIDYMIASIKKIGRSI